MNSSLPKVLLVDDDTNVLMALHALLGKEFDLRAARTGREALRLAHVDPPEVILLDIEMPEMDGYETCRRFKADPLLAEIPIIFLTSYATEEAEVRGLTLGASDFISKPPRGSTVAARVNNSVRMKRMDGLIRAMAFKDGLTGLSNRRHFDQSLSNEWLRAMRTSQSLALVMADVDHFKFYNDHYGHPAGDGCLRAVALAMGAAVRRPADMAARYGGEEFVMLLPDTSEAGARRVAEQIRLAVVDAALPHAASPVAAMVTLSLGVSVFDPKAAGTTMGSLDSGFVPHDPQVTAWDLLLAADRALYAAKAHGRNAAWFLDIDHRESPNLAEAIAGQSAAPRRTLSASQDPPGETHEPIQ